MEGGASMANPPSGVQRQVSDQDTTAKKIDRLIANMSPNGAEFFVFGGSRYDNKEQFLQAASRNISEGATVELSDQEKLETTARKVFREYAGVNGRVGEDHIGGLVASVAAELGINPAELGSPYLMFCRHDFTGDGHLDEEEGVRMVSELLHQYRDHKTPWKAKAGEPKLIRLPFRSLEENFQLKRKLGSGGQGIVYLAVEKATSTERVVKFFSKDNANAPLDDIKDEFKLLKSLDHPRVQRLYDIFEDRKNVYIISEPYKGGDLNSLVPRAKGAGVAVTNHWLGQVCHQVLQGVAYLHSKHVMHCDLKEANAMISEANNWVDPAIVVIDFGLADKFTAKRMRTAGTPGYMPPEVWSHRLWTAKGDVHSLGVMFYQMFTGEQCYPASTQAEIERKTLSMQVDLEPLGRYGSLQSLVGDMLNKDYKKRPTCGQVLEAPFFASLQELQEEDLPQRVVNGLCGVGKKNEVFNAIVADIAQLENLAQMQEINKAFTAIDTDNSGIIDEAEAREKLAEQLPPEKVEAVVAALLGDDNKVSYTEFMGQMLLALETDMDRVLWKEFQALDKNQTGSLTADEIEGLLVRPALAAILVGKKAPDLMVLMDKDSNGAISFEEFSSALRGEKAANTVVCDPPKSDPQEAWAPPSKAEGPTSPRKDACPEVSVPMKERKSEKDRRSEASHPDKAVSVEWKHNRLQAFSTRRLMKEASNSAGWEGAGAHCAGALGCCWWIPLIFFMAATNVEDDCELGLGIWLRICGLVSILTGPCLHVLAIIFAHSRMACLFKCTRILFFNSVLIVLGMSLSGFVVYAVVSEPRCLKEDWSGIHPITLTLVWAILVPGLMCLSCCVGVLCFLCGAAVEAKVAPS